MLKLYFFLGIFESYLLMLSTGRGGATTLNMGRRGAKDFGMVAKQFLTIQFLLWFLFYLKMLL